MKDLSKGKCAIALTISIVSWGASHAGTTNVSIRFDQAALRPSPLSKENFGSGFQFENADIRLMFKDSSVAKSYNMLKAMNFGVIRFPHGTRALFYYWNDVPDSYSNLGVPSSSWLLPLDVYENFAARDTSYTAVQYALPGDLLFQVNTYQSIKITNGVKNWLTVPVMQNGVPANDASGQKIIDQNGLTQAAEMAAQWVAANHQLPYNQQAEFWEIGNEDWVYWTPSQYALIFKTFAEKMIQANCKSVAGNGSTCKPLKLLAQALAINSDFRPGGVNQPRGEYWVSDFADALHGLGFSLGNVYALSQHMYINGDQLTNVRDRTISMFSKTAFFDEVATTRSWAVAIKNKYALPQAWQVWMTEFNTSEDKDSLGNPIPAETKAKGVILGDWAAHMLEYQVDRVMPHSLEADPQWAMFNYRNNGGSPQTPIMMPYGAVIGRLAGNFTGSMYKADSDSAAPAPGYYQLLRAYSAYDSVNKKLNVLLVNKDLDNPTTVTLSTIGSRSFIPGGAFSYSALTGADLNTTNINASNPDLPPVRWDTPIGGSVAQTCTGSGVSKTCKLGTAITVPPASMVHVTLPAQ